jgi:hypothetical protein
LVKKASWDYYLKSLLGLLIKKPWAIYRIKKPRWYLVYEYVYVLRMRERLASTSSEAKQYQQRSVALYRRHESNQGKLPREIIDLFSFVVTKQHNSVYNSKHAKQ